MFGALNRFIARLDAEPPPQHTKQGPNDNSYGFQVLRNANKDLPLEPWFDFIIGLNGHQIDSPDPNLFSTELQNCAGGYCSLDVWTAKGQRTHSLTVPIPHSPDSLGLTLQLAPLTSTNNIWHVLTIPSSHSPAHVAGLLPHSDYIIGSPSGTLKGESALGELVEDHLNRSLVLWVYNSEFDVVREVELVPRRGWGGEGALGAVLGFGALHRLPVGLGEEIAGPGENLFDADRKSADLRLENDAANTFQPAPVQNVAAPPMINPNLPPPPMMNPNVRSTSQTGGTVRSKKGRQHAALSPGAGFEDMFAEGAKKSAEQDYVSSRKGSPLPPPPPPKIETHPPPSGKGQKEAGGDDIDLGEPGEAEET